MVCCLLASSLRKSSCSGCSRTTTWRKTTWTGEANVQTPLLLLWRDTFVSLISGESAEQNLSWFSGRLLSGHSERPYIWKPSKDERRISDQPTEIYNPSPDAYFTRQSSSLLSSLFSFMSVFITSTATKWKLQLSFACFIRRSGVEAMFALCNESASCSHFGLIMKIKPLNWSCSPLYCSEL